MKTLNLKWQIAVLALAISISIFSCKKSTIEEINPQSLSSSLKLSTNSTTSSVTLPSTSSSSPYLVTLESITNNGDGTYTWIWSVQNPNPGNGLNGTVQDLSHWNITLGQCAKPEDIIAESMSEDGINWMINSSAIYQPDPSQNCYTDSVIKFNMGTSGAQKSFYQLTVNKNFSVDSLVTGVYKSGQNTACGTFVFSGFGCPVIEETSCSLSQGYYFAKPDLVWSSTVTIGGYTYTQAEGKAIWNTSNKGGIRDSKAGFTQVTAIKLSTASISTSASVWADVAIVETYLAGLGKLSPTNLPTGDTAAKEAAGRIGDWIDNNHCLEQ